MTKYHNTDNGPKPCTDKTDRCPYAKQGDPHFSSKKEAQAAYDQKMSAEHGITAVPLSQRPNHMAHIKTIQQKLQEAERDLQARDKRQWENQTVIDQLAKEDPLASKRIGQLLGLKAWEGEGGLGVLKSTFGQSVVGVSYNGNQEKGDMTGLLNIQEALRKGKLGKDAVSYIEDENGIGYFTVTARDTQKTPDKYESYPGDDKKHFDEIQKRFQSDRRGWDNYNLSDIRKLPISQLKAEIEKRSGAKTELSDKEDLAQEVLRLRTSGLKIPVGGIDNGIFKIASDDPVMKSTMKKMQEAHENGSLRIGESTGSFARGVMFYDDRDVSRKDKIIEIKQKVVHEAAEKHILQTKKLLQSRGMLFSVEPSQNDPDLADLTEARYWLNYSPKNSRHQITGDFTQREIEKIAETGTYPQKIN